MKYIAFLRGINVGGNRLVKMSDLAKYFEEMGFTNIKTLLNTGNIIFESDETDYKKLEKRVEESLEKSLGFLCNTILRSIDSIQQMVKANPFQEIEVTKQTRLYVTFLQEDTKSPLKLPYASEDKNFQILALKNNSLFSVLIVTKNGQSLKLMDKVTQEYGKQTTTRNWNTIIKISKL